MRGPHAVSSDSPSRHQSAEDRFRSLFEEAGWRVAGAAGRPRVVMRRGGLRYAVVLKSAAEGRSDRLVPLLAQALLEARESAGSKAAPLAVVAAPRVAQKVSDAAMAFADRYVPDVAVGLIDLEGFARFRGPGLDAINSSGRRAPFAGRPPVRASGQLFSDLNQWMLKVLLAPELQEALLKAPRGQYRNASELARAADVSVMSAFRFVQQLRREGYLDEAAPYLQLVRRGDLFNRWQALAARSVPEAPMRFLLPGDRPARLRRLLETDRACLALFAAADALRLGFVSGVPPYIYVRRLDAGSFADGKALRACGPGDPPDVIVRQAPAPQSVFRALVRPGGTPACDVLQVWLDVGSHPARGREQADLIRERVLERLIAESR